MHNESGVVEVNLSSDGWRVVTAAYAGTTRTWDAQSGEPVGEPMSHGLHQTVRAASFSPDGRRVVTVSDDIARVWDVQSGEPVGERMGEGREGKVRRARLRWEGQRM